MERMENDADTSHAGGPGFESLRAHHFRLGLNTRNGFVIG
jgi:hypothetical protein